MSKKKAKMGRPVVAADKRLGPRFTLRLTVAEDARLRAVARRRGVKIAVVIRDALARELES
jgi:hypothetical protein